MFIQTRRSKRLDIASVPDADEEYIHFVESATPFSACRICTFKVATKLEYLSSLALAGIKTEEY